MALLELLLERAIKWELHVRGSIHRLQGDVFELSRGGKHDLNYGRIAG